MPKCLFNISQFRAGFAQVRAGLQVIEDQLVCALAPVGAAYWNPSDKGASVTLTNSDKTASANYEAVRSITSHSTGKYYGEILAGGDLDDSNLGFANATFGLTAFLGGDTNGVSIYGFNGDIYENGSATSGGSAILNGSHTDFAIDLDAKKLWIRQAGSWRGGGDPAAGTGGYTYSVTGALFFCAYIQSGGKTVTLRTNSSEFAGTVPTGFSAWG